MLTGSYHNYFRIFDVDSLSDVVLQADKSAFKAKKIGGPLPGNKLGAKNGTRGLRDAMQMETLDFNKKILHASWHPRENTIAVRFIPSFRCGGSADIHLCSLDRCNEQPVLIQRGVMFVLVKSIVQLCRRRLLPTLLSSCRRLSLFHSPIHFSVTVIYFSDAEHTLLHHYCLPSALSRSFRPRFLLASHAAPTPFWTLAPAHFWFRLSSPTRSPSFLIPYPRASTPPVQSLSVDQTRS